MNQQSLFHIDKALTNLYVDDTNHKTIYSEKDTIILQFGRFWKSYDPFDTDP